MRLRPSLAGAVVALRAMPAAPAAAADPPAFTKLLKKCYVSASPMSTEPVEIHAAYFMPLAPGDVYLDNAGGAPPPGTNPPIADANGLLDGQISAPYIASGQR